MFFCQEGKPTQQHAEDTNVLTEPLAAGLGTALPPSIPLNRIQGFNQTGRKAGGFQLVHYMCPLWGASCETLVWAEVFMWIWEGSH